MYVLRLISGHSRRKNIFLYGCSPHLSWKRTDRLCSGDKTLPLVVPAALDQLAPAFSLADSCFTIEKNRETTARVTIWRELGVQLSYTMEASQGACDRGIYSGKHLGIDQLTEMGESLCLALNVIEFRAQGEQVIPVLPDDLAHKFAER